MSTSMGSHMHQDIQPGSLQRERVYYTLKVIHIMLHRMHEDLSLEASVSELDKLEKEFAAIVKDRAAAEPELR